MVKISRQVKRVIPLFILPLAVVGSFASNLRERLSEPQFELIHAPTEWVPFQANFRVTHRNSKAITQGRFYRRSDGSTRLESGPALDDIRLVFIRNMPDETIYIRKGTGWSRQPFTPVNGGAPEQWRKGMPTWELLPERVGVFGRFGSHELMDAYEIVDGATRRVIVPALNFWEIDKDIQGRRQVYRNIRLTESDLGLFAPPVGVHVENLPEHVPPKPKSHDHSHS